MAEDNTATTNLGTQPVASARQRRTAISHGELTFHNPLSAAIHDEAIDLIVSFAVKHVTEMKSKVRHIRLLDIGCGRGELCLRTALAIHAAITDKLNPQESTNTVIDVLGIDSSPLAIHEACSELKERGNPPHVTFAADATANVSLNIRFECGEFDWQEYQKTHIDELPDILLCTGSTHIVAPPDSQAFSKRYETLRSLLAPTGVQIMCIADIVWRHTPEQEYLQELHMSEDDMPYEADIKSCIKDEFHDSICNMWSASEEQFLQYETTLSANMNAFLAQHPNDDHADGFRKHRQWWDELQSKYGAAMGYTMAVLHCSSSAHTK
jgi:SAM-dependent methyltransferase